MEPNALMLNCIFGHKPSIFASNHHYTFKCFLFKPNTFKLLFKDRYNRKRGGGTNHKHELPQRILLSLGYCLTSIII